MHASSRIEQLPTVAWNQLGDNHELVEALERG